MAAPFVSVQQPSAADLTGGFGTERGDGDVAANRPRRSIFRSGVATQPQDLAPNPAGYPVGGCPGIYGPVPPPVVMDTRSP
ncbi:hypothetical protein KILIM_017_00280 [Kineosphaera limosa NBRC 100340]|uniref:Uncharacterized protein n=1 Tax=Kineosphaera limosa NBRC 100340 TaxID=1184609 RepID=K6VG73_9MICO|nr:hypothetical protein KILIM_017_00280 [Kineosphaera limosa NBRC 100340]